MLVREECQEKLKDHTTLLDHYLVLYAKYYKLYSIDIMTRVKPTKSSTGQYNV